MLEFLKTADHTGQTDEGYSYDTNGNRTGGGYTVGSNNQLLSDGTHNYTYDDEGNRLTKTKISTSEKEEYTWYHRNRLTKVTFKNASSTITKTVDHTYDPFNRWIKRTVDPDGTTGSAALVDTIFSYFGGQIALEFDGSAAADLTHRYLWGPAVDQIMADESVTTLTSAGTVLWPLGDHLGTPRDLATYNATTNDTAIVNHRRYDSYGILISETNSGIDLLFGYTARPFDDWTGLNNHWHRWFTFHVWLNEDPKGFAAGDTNLYRYVGNGVTVRIDFDGLDWKNIFSWRLNREGPRGTWTGERGNSTFKFADTSIPDVNYFDGQPDFRPFTWCKNGEPGIVDIAYDGDLSKSDDARRTADYKAADLEMKRRHGSRWTRGKYTWHHEAVDGETGMGVMRLVETNVHDATKHTGAFAIYTKFLKAKNATDKAARKKAVNELMEHSNGIRKWVRRGAKATVMLGFAFALCDTAQAYSQDGVEGAYETLAKELSPIPKEELEFILVFGANAVGDFFSINPTGAEQRAREKFGEHYKQLFPPGYWDSEDD